MTKHTKISVPQGKKGSLIERADAAFGLGGLGPSRVPADLPPAKPHDRAPRSVTQREQPAAPEPSRSPEATATDPAEGPRVALAGPSVEIDRQVLSVNGLIVPEEPVSGLLEEFRIIKRELLASARRSRNGAARRILLSSPHEGEGKTFCAANLAIALGAERDIEVVLVDADVMDPSITRIFGIEERPGFMDALADPSLRPEDLVIETDIEGLFILPAGILGARDTEYLASARTQKVLERLSQGAPNRFFIFDTPPALAASPAAELAAFVGQALLVVRADQTSRAAIEDARNLLSACRDLKLLLNAAKFSPSGRRFGHYRQGVNP
jgi:Mrp family chromosome partitioning ATPase